MSVKQRLDEAIEEAKRQGVLREYSNPLDMHRFAIAWLLDQVDSLETRLAVVEQKRGKK